MRTQAAPCDPDAASRTYTVAADPGRIVTGPHAPAATCSGCADLFAAEPPDGCSGIHDAADLFLSVEHLSGYTALRPLAGRPLPDRPRWSRGQALVEFALVVPIALGLLLGVCELARFGSHVWAADRAAYTLADWSAMHGGDIDSAQWGTVAVQELQRADCDGQADATLPDGTAPGSRVVVTVTCAYSALFTPGVGRDYGTQTSSVIR